jgi:glutamate dehydrogenase
LDFPEYKEPAFQFPEYIEPIAIMANLEAASPVNKMVEQVIRTPGRQPSPQPTHFSVPLPTYKNGNGNGNGNGHRVLRSATVGYIAPEFKGKQEQIDRGMVFSEIQILILTIV